MKDVKRFLTELRKELQRGEDYDLEAMHVLDELHQDSDRIAESDETHIKSMVERVRALESKFASNHPGLERAARELGDALAKMGI